MMLTAEASVSTPGTGKCHSHRGGSGDGRAGVLAIFQTSALISLHHEDYAGSNTLSVQRALVHFIGTGSRDV